MSRVVCRPPTGPPKKRAPVVRAADHVGRRHTRHGGMTAPPLSPLPPPHPEYAMAGLGGDRWKRRVLAPRFLTATAIILRRVITYPNPGNVNRYITPTTASDFAAAALKLEAIASRKRLKRWSVSNSILSVNNNCW